MLRWIFRAIFLLVLVGVLFINASSEELAKEVNSTSWWSVVISGLGMMLFFFLLEVFTPKEKLGALAGVFFALLVGLIISGVLAPAVDMIAGSYKIELTREAVFAIKWMMGICICFLIISIVMRTKDDVRFVIPYVEFAKQTKGARPLVLDTSVIIDGFYY